MKFESNGLIHPAIKNEDVKGFRVLRSYCSDCKFNVYAVDEFGVPLVPMFTDLLQEEAMRICQALNTPYDGAEHIQYKTVEVEYADGSLHYYQVQE